MSAAFLASFRRIPIQAPRQATISRVVDDHRLMVTYLGKSWMVDQVFFDGHVAAVVNAARPVRWTLVSENGRES